MRCIFFAILLLAAVTVRAQSPRSFPVGNLPNDSRLGELRTLNSYFPFKAVQNEQDWIDRQADIKRRILVSQGMWPMPTRTSLNAVEHGRVDYGDYSVSHVYFESIPGHFVTGSLYRPSKKSGPFPAVLSPHGHWQDARFYDAGELDTRTQLRMQVGTPKVHGHLGRQTRSSHVNTQRKVTRQASYYETEYQDAN